MNGQKRREEKLAVSAYMRKVVSERARPKFFVVLGIQIKSNHIVKVKKKATQANSQTKHD
jgi:hypothetical protein